MTQPDESMRVVAIRKRLTRARENEIMVQVTPEMAEEFLAVNINNRPLQLPMARAIAADIRAGRFHYSGDTLKIDTNGNFFDGQHRCKGCLIANMPFETDIAYGLRPEAQLYTDLGVKRSAADMLVLSGRVDKGGQTIQAIARTAIIREEGGHTHVKDNTNGIRRVTNSEIAAWFDRNPDAPEAAKVGSSMSRQMAGYITPSALGYIYLVLSRIDAMTATQIVMDFANREGGVGTPVKAMINAYEKYNHLHTHPRITGHMYIWFTAWNALIRGQAIDEISPFPFKRGGIVRFQPVPKPRTS